MLSSLGSTFKRNFQCLLRDLFSQAHQSWDRQIRLGPWFLSSTPSGRTWIGCPRASHHSTSSSGGALQGRLHGRLWRSLRGSRSFRHLSPSMRQQHIHVLELEALILAFWEFCPSLAGKGVLLSTDNTTVASYINKLGGARSRPLSPRAGNLLLWCESRGISLRATHVPGGFNVLADSLSRAHSIMSTVWTLDRSVLLPVWQTLLTPHVDLFATCYSHRLPLYVSPVPDPLAFAVDSFPALGRTSLRSLLLPSQS